MRGTSRSAGLMAALAVIGATAQLGVGQSLKTGMENVRVASAALTQPRIPQQKRASAGSKHHRLGLGSYRYRAFRYSNAGWSVAEGKRRARKARNVKRHKQHARGA